MDNLTIVQSNELIDASYSLSIDELRLICLASTKVDSGKPNIGEIKIHVAEYIEAYGLQGRNDAYDLLRHAVKSIMRKPIKLFDGNEVLELAWLAMNKYQRSDDGSYVVIAFSHYVEPYLFELKERFTSINFEYAARLNTPFSFRLYQWLYKAKNLNKHKVGDAVAVELEIDWMKSQAGLIGVYDRWGHFNERVLRPAIDKINANTDISIVEPMPIRTGRKVTAVRFIYAPEKITQAKPVRPRLYRRPKVVKGSHEEGEWMRKNFKLLNEYREALISYDPKAKMMLKDLCRMAEYAAIFDKDLEYVLRKEINNRSSNIS